MKTGTVKFFNHAKGFGFIKQSDSQKDIFVHKSGLIDNIKDNDEVEYSVKEDAKGPSAVQVRVI